jgi:hypothetical protein
MEADLGDSDTRAAPSLDVRAMAFTARHHLEHTQDERRYQRVPVLLHGRFMLPDRSEHECITVDMSPGGALLKTSVRGHVDDRVVAYIETIGRIEGHIIRQTADGFAMTIAATSRRRDKLASQLTWLTNRGELGLPEDRRHERYIPRNPHGRLTTSTGAEVMVRLIDVSLSGAAFNTDLSFDRGDLIMLNQTPARIVRIFDRGVACEFTRAPAQDAFEI